MMDKKRKQNYRPLIDLHAVHEGLLEADKLIGLLGHESDKVKKALETIGIIKYKIGDLVEYQQKDEQWVNGIVVCFMICEPKYICREGDVRESPGEEYSLLAHSEEYVRPRKDGPDE